MNGTWRKSRINYVCSVSLFSHTQCEYPENGVCVGGCCITSPHSFVRVSARSLFLLATLGKLRLVTHFLGILHSGLHYIQHHDAAASGLRLECSLSHVHQAIGSLAAEKHNVCSPLRFHKRHSWLVQAVTMQPIGLVLTLNQGTSSPPTKHRPQYSDDILLTRHSQNKKSEGWQAKGTCPRSGLIDESVD